MFKLTDDNKRGLTVLCFIMLLFILGRACIRTRRETAKKSRIEQDSIKLSEFDPNTVELPQLLEMGLSKQEALSILRYRAAGKVFNIKEELIACYSISDSLYYALEPYIVIGEEFKYKVKKYDDAPAKRDPQTQTPQKTYTPKSYKREPEVKISEFLADTVGIKYLVGVGALSQRQAEVFVKWRDMSGIHSMDELQECYVVSNECAEMLRPYIIFTPRAKELAKSKEQALVDLNKADIAELVSVYGIGEKSALAILDYRDKLGGFYCTEQISEIKIITESNYEKIIQQILVDSCDISKIDVNFASAKELSGHPYIESKQLRRLLKYRQLKGGWRTLEEMIEDNIFDKAEAERLRPYLQFDRLGEFNER